MKTSEISIEELSCYEAKEKESRECLKYARGWIRHWHLCNLSNAIYEQRRYKESLEPIEKAYRIAPDCPLVIWNYIGTLRMLGKIEEARKLCRGIINTNINKLAKGQCGEGTEWARSLVNDCRYMMAITSTVYKEKVMWYKMHLQFRSRKVSSIFNKQMVSKQLEEVVEEYKNQ